MSDHSLTLPNPPPLLCELKKGPIRDRNEPYSPFLPCNIIVHCGRRHGHRVFSVVATGIRKYFGQ
jgi:hypothetical protein